MARPKKFVGNKRDGFVSFRIPADMSNQINCLCFLLEKSGAEVVVQAMKEFIGKYQVQVDSLVKAKSELTDPLTETTEDNQQTGPEGVE